MRFLALGALIALPTLQSEACLHPPREYSGKMGSQVQEYLLYRLGDTVHLVTNQWIGADGAFPAEVAWVIPLPSVPLSYAAEKEDLFPRLFHATEEKRRGGTQSLGIRLHEPVRVGRYDITPVEARDGDAGKAINDWLHDNGYHRVPEAGLRYYVKPGACFLAIKVKGLASLQEQLRPLHIAYRSKEMRVPLKFFANAGEFDTYLYAVLDSKEAGGSRELEKWGFRWNGEVLLDSAKAASLSLPRPRNPATRLVRYFGKKTNGKGNRIIDWKEDPLISTY